MVALALVNMLVMFLRFPIGLCNGIADRTGNDRTSNRLTKSKKGRVWRQFKMYLQKNWQNFSITIRTLWRMTSNVRRQTRQLLLLGIKLPRTNAN